MTDQKYRDAFEIYNEGVDRILQEFGPCRRFLAELKDQEGETGKLREDLEEEHRGELEKIDDDISREKDKIPAAEKENQKSLSEEERKNGEKEAELAKRQKKLLAEKDEAIRSIQGKLTDLAQVIDRTKAPLENPLTPETVADRTEKFQKDPGEFGKAEARYVEENQDQERLDEKRRREERLKKRREGAAAEAETNAQFLFSDEINKMETFDGSDPLATLGISPEQFQEEVKKITDHREELIREDVEALMDGTRKQNETRLAVIKENHEKNLNRKEQLKTVGRWILCFPINLVKDRFSLSKEMLDYGGMGVGIVGSLLMLFNSKLLGLIITATIVAGLGYGCLLGMKKRKGGFGMTLGIIQGLGGMVIRILPYPILLFLVTRSVTLWATWLAAGIFLYAAYDAYYMLRKFQPSYRKLYQKYAQERAAYYEKRLAEMKDALEKYEGFLVAETENVNQELEKEAEEIAALTRAVDEEVQQLKKTFAESVWDRLTEAFRERLQQQLETEIRQEKERLARLDKLQEEEREQQSRLSEQEDRRAEIQKEGRQKEELLANELQQIRKSAAGRLADRKQKIEQEVKRLENRRQQRQRQQQEALTRFESEREQQHQALDQRFQEELNRLTGQMRADGFKNVCGFDYREAWAAMHGMLTNLSCYPSNLDCYLNRRKEEGGVDVLQKMLAAEQGIDEEALQKAKAKNGSCSCYMPRNILWGAEACGEDELEIEIQAGLEKVLREAEEFKGASGWGPDQISEYGIRKLPGDTLYRLKLVDSQDRPLLVYYDLGDMDKDTAARKSLCHYIMKTFVFRPLFYIGNKDYFSCDVLVSDYPEDYKQFEQNPLLQKNIHVVEKHSFSRILDGLYDRGEKVWKRLKPYGSLYEKNRERCKKGVNPAKDDGYSSLIITNMDYKALSNTRLKNLLNLSCQEKGNPCGVYPYVFVDLNWMRNHKEETDRASVDYCRELVKSFQGKCCLLEKRDGEYCFVEKNSTDELYELLGTMN